MVSRAQEATGKGSDEKRGWQVERKGVAGGRGWTPRPGLLPEQPVSTSLSNDTVSATAKGDGLWASAPTQAQKEFCL